MPQTDHDRVIALAALFQATTLVRDIAQTGQADAADFATCINSLYKTDTDNSEEIYQSVKHLRTGLITLQEQLSRSQDLQITRYALSLLALERKLSRKPALLGKIHQEIQAAAGKLQYFAPEHDNLIAHFAEAYANTVSTLTPKIMVHGPQMHLTKPENANRIRTLLLAGIRAAMLWQQSGGSRLSLLLRRKPLLLETEQLLNMVADDVG